MRNGELKLKKTQMISYDLLRAGEPVLYPAGSLLPIWLRQKKQGNFLKNKHQSFGEAASSGNISALYICICLVSRSISKEEDFKSVAVLRNSS